MASFSQIRLGQVRRQQIAALCLLRGLPAKHAAHDLGMSVKNAEYHLAQARGQIRRSTLSLLHPVQGSRFEVQGSKFPLL